MPNRISLKYINRLCGIWLRGKERKAAFSQGFIRVSRYAKQALGPMDGSWRRGSPRTSTSLIEESGTRRSPKTSTRSDEGIREATDLRGQALGLMKEFGGRGSTDIHRPFFLAKMVHFPEHFSGSMVHFPG